MTRPRPPRHRLTIGRWLGAEECADGHCAVKGK